MIVEIAMEKSKVAGEGLGMVKDDLDTKTGALASYYKKGDGCKVWDLNNNVYYDFAQMGVGTCILGYACSEVNKSVKEAISQSSMTTLNSFEEVR